ncbi:MAG TPA: tripartite tricarboxylate transporter substrate binding protein [Casimicrobiaceae bacterium]|nr:tripartite tricarboxylate transporter substrate binding protein [Casimicrobiaceae bacterium]
MMTLVLAGSAFAQTDWPQKPVRIVVPFPAGGATDVVARQIGQKLAEKWGQAVVIDNRGGAGGNIGAEVVAKSPADGYTLLMTSGSIVTANQWLYKSLPYNAEKDLVPITNVASGPQTIVVHPDVAAKTLADLIAMAKAKPRGVNFGSAGIGSQTHLAGENFFAAANIDVTHVPYKGEGPALADLVAGQIQFMTANLAAALPFIQSGRLRALAVTSKQRSAALPDVPTVSDTLPGFENLGWFGLMAPAGTPQAIIEKVYADSAKALSDSDLKTRLDTLGMMPVGNRPEAMKRAIAEETKLWEGIVRARNLSAN